MKLPHIKTMVFAFLAATVSAVAQTSRPVIIDLDGTWEAPISDTEYVKIVIRHDENRLLAFHADHAPGRKEKLLFTATYKGERSFSAEVEPDIPGNPTRDLTITVQDPDNFQTVSQQHSRSFVRISPPKLNDIPCDPRNDFHATADGAMSRAAVAEDAEQYSTAFCWAMIAGKMGSASGEFVVGEYFRAGTGVEKNPARAMGWLLASAKQGYSNAQRSLGFMFAYGEGVPANLDEADYWLLKAENHSRETQSDQTTPSSGQRNCVVGASPGPNPNRRIQTYCRSN